MAQTQVLRKALLTKNMVIGSQLAPGLRQSGREKTKEVKLSISIVLRARMEFLRTTGVQNASYTPDEYKFEMLSPDVVVMTHRGTTKGMQNGKEVTESHRSLHVFQKLNGRWQVVANAQLPIAQ